MMAVMGLHNEESEGQNILKGNVKRIVSGLLSAVTVLSAFLQPIGAYAAEPEPAAYEAEYPALEKVKEKLDADEIVDAEDYTVEIDSSFDVEHDFSGGDRSGRSGEGTAQEGVHLCQQHLGAEWLCHIVVRAVIIAFQFIVLRTPGGEHDNGHIAHFPRHLADGKAVQMGHHHIQDHQIHRMIFQRDKSIYAIVCGKAGVPALPHIVRDDVLHGFFVFNN